jgi:hypothetical protein
VCVLAGQRYTASRSGTHAYFSCRFLASLHTSRSQSRTQCILTAPFLPLFHSQVQFQAQPPSFVAAVLTTRRLLLTDARLTALATVRIPSLGSQHAMLSRSLHSCVWVGLALFYADADAVHLLAWDGTSHRVASTAAGTDHHPSGTALLTALPDCLLYAFPYLLPALPATSTPLSGAVGSRATPKPGRWVSARLRSR